LDASPAIAANVRTVSEGTIHNSLVLGQVKVDEKSNEITAIPQLLKTYLAKVLAT
jgi:hypothetical protein